MNQLNKLIEQYETENPGKKAYYSYRMGQIPDRPNPRFMDWMAELASRPTCGVEQRKFLDEVEKLMNVPESGFITLNEFQSDIKKVIQGK